MEGEGGEGLSAVNEVRLTVLARRALGPMVLGGECEIVGSEESISCFGGRW